MKKLFEDRVVPNVPVAFWKDLEEKITAAFATAHLITQKLYDVPEQVPQLAQHRHGLCERAFREVAANAGMDVSALKTVPPGGRYSLAQSQGVFILRANIQTHCGPPRASKFRQEMATMNAWINPFQPDLWRSVSPPPSDHLSGFIVTTSPRRSKQHDPSVPSFIGLGLPRDDLKKWVYLWPIEEVISIYHDMQPVKAEPEIRVKDRAIPRLKVGDNN